MTEFKEHAKEEVMVPPTITQDHPTGAFGSNVTDTKSSGYIMSSSQNGGVPREEEYKLEYWGRYEVPPPGSSNNDQVMIIDTLVSKCREAVSGSATLGKFRKKRTFGSKFMRHTSKGLASSVGTEDVDSLSATSTTSIESEGDSIATNSISCAPLKSTSSIDSSDSSDVSITLTPSSPPPPPEEEVACDSSTSPEDPADHHTPFKQSTLIPTASSVVNPSNATTQRSDSSDFDTLPELANLKSSTEFQALSLKATSGASGSVQCQQKVRLLFSGVNVVVVTEQTEHVILRKSIRNIACCAQVSQPHPYHTHSQCCAAG